MKVSGTGGPKAPGAVSRVADAPRVEAATPSRAVDAIEFADVPDAELTPRVRAALTALMKEVSDLRKELADARRKMGELELLASADPLTGVLNRRAFVSELNRALAAIERYGHPASLVFIDVDDLKKINDSLGHAAGDAALAHSAKVVGANIRQTDVFGRIGGDEFAVILTNTPGEAARMKAQSLAALVKSTLAPDGAAVSVTCGAVEIAAGLTAEAALSAADKAMYEEKRRR